MHFNEKCTADLNAHGNKRFRAEARPCYCEVQFGSDEVLLMWDCQYISNLTVRTPSVPVLTSS